MVEVTESLRAELVTIRERIAQIEALLEEKDRNHTLSNQEAAAKLGITRQAASYWARNHGVGAVRDGYRVIGRLPGERGGWRWAPVN